MPSRRLLFGIAGILGLQLAVSLALAMGEQPPVAPTLGEFPHELGNWRQVREQAMDPDVVAYLRPDDYFDRTYINGNRQGSQVNLFVAYFKSLKSGYGPHSPSVCLPGAGWKAKHSELIQIPISGDLGQIPANMFVLEKGQQNMLVLYWYQNDRRIWAEEFQAKIYMLPDLLRYHRSDVALVRVILPLESGAFEVTKASGLEFVRTMLPKLSGQFSAS